MIINMNEKTQIRYGVISNNSVHPEVLHDILCSGVNVDLLDSLVSYFQEENTPMPFYEESKVYSYEEAHDLLSNLLCLWDDQEGATDYDFEGGTMWFKLEGVEGMMSETYTTIIESPGVSKCNLCSPCFPNAGDLEVEGDYEAYDIPKDWRANYECHTLLSEGKIIHIK